MPYKSINELPENVRNVLPQHAQEIYKEAFNNAYQEYANPDNRRDEASREEGSHRVAWSAVKKASYTKGADEKWHNLDK